ncbi:MAG TPA: hypothetical protein PKA29_03440 [Candidatus Saccharibacteria bacterium]|nr:hypothetical protein [Candidatus Saccharibacteria bacterium]
MPIFNYTPSLLCKEEKLAPTTEQRQKVGISFRKSSQPRQSVRILGIYFKNRI